MFLTLFVVSFVSATLWPLASEAVFVGFLHQNSDALLTLLLVATLGNSLGAMLMFELAMGSSNWLQKRVNLRNEELIRWQVRLTQYGSPLMVLAWLPIIGDLLPIAGGLLKMKRFWVYFWLTLGKAGRYSVVSAVALGLLSP